jgi:hypothetical protein
MVIVELEHGDEELQVSLVDIFEGVEPVSQILRQTLHARDDV